MTPRRIASQRRTQVPHSATGDSRKDALWGCHSHGKAHSACGPHQKAHSACERSRRVRLSVRVRSQSAPFRSTSPVQNALFRRVRFSSPAQTWRRLTQRRTLGVSLSRKGALCVWALTKGRALHAGGGCAERPFSPICVHSCIPTAARATGRDHGPHDIEGPMAPVMPGRSDLRPTPPGR